MAKVNAWDRRDGESAQAYAAFRVYLELGPDRSLLKAYRKVKGKGDEVFQVDGRWYQWSRDHEWSARARAWDLRMDAVRDKAAERIVAEQAERSVHYWNGQRDQYNCQFLARGAQLLDKAQRLLQFPVETVRKEQGIGGQVTIIEAAKPGVFKVAAELVEKAQAIIRAAVNDGLILARESERVAPLTTAAMEARERAARELDDWIRQQRAAIAELPESPPLDEEQEEAPPPRAASA